MRHMIIFGLIFAIAAVPTVQAQEVAAPAAAEQATLPALDVVFPAMDARLLPPRAESVQLGQELVDANAVPEMSATTALALIGGAVVILALIALLR